MTKLFTWTVTERLFLLGDLHHAEMFTGILSAIGRDIEDGLVFVENIGRDLQRLLKTIGESGEESGRAPWRMNNKMVSNLTCYELAIRIMIEESCLKE